MKNLSVHEARRLMLEKAPRLGFERVELAAAHGRVLAKSVIANRDQPPFFAAAMDGYAIRRSDLSPTGAVLLVIGESAAGGGFDRPVAAGQCVRIFTGAPLPKDCDLVIVQEVSDAKAIWPVCLLILAPHAISAHKAAIICKARSC